MKKQLILAILIGFISFSFSLAKGVMSFDNFAVENRDNHTALEQAKGEEIWNKFQNKEMKCNDLTNDDYEDLGEYFMGRMMGDSHEAMNNRMIQMMGNENEKQMHVVMGKRMSNCEPNTPMPQNMINDGMMPMMMGMMIKGGGNSMMGNFGANQIGWFSFSWIFMILFWVFAIIGIVALIKWLVNQGKGEIGNKSSLDIIKERYAKGEIDKKEFEEKKKDLT